jgi:hypothetical protein
MRPLASRPAPGQAPRYAALMIHFPHVDDSRITEDGHEGRMARGLAPVGHEQ